MNTQHWFGNMGVSLILPALNNIQVYFQVRDITVFTVFRLLTDFVCLYAYEFWLSLCKIVRSSVILLLPLHTISDRIFFLQFNMPLVTTQYSIFKILHFTCNERNIQQIQGT
jgi:hypothetical protein